MSEYIPTRKRAGRDPLPAAGYEEAASQEEAYEEACEEAYAEAPEAPMADAAEAEMPGEDIDPADVFFRMSHIDKFYNIGDERMQVLKDICLSVEEGDFLSILGPSGSGKSTLMNIIGCLDVPNEGEYILRGQLIESMTENELSDLRNREIGFVFQNSQLLPRLDALRNVELPLIYAGVPPRERTRRAKEMLEMVGLQDRMHHYANQLSGGKQRRVAIARALVTNPTLLLADEPTGALDQKTGRQVMELFRRLNGEGRTIIMITHDLGIAANARRVVHIIDGELTEEEIMHE